MDQEQEFKKTIHDFYRVYRELQKHMELRSVTHFSLYTDNYIEIWHYRGEVKGKLLLKVKVQKGEENADIECYKKAAELIKNILREQEKKGEAYGRVYTDHAR